MQLILECRDDAEITTASTYRPVQVRVLVRAQMTQLSIGGNEVCSQNVIDRETELPIGSPKASAKREATHPRMGDDARRHRQLVCERCGIHMPEKRAATDHGCLFVDIDLDRVH